MKLFNWVSGLMVLIFACLIAAKVDNIIHEVRFAEVYRYSLIILAGCAQAAKPLTSQALVGIRDREINLRECWRYDSYPHE